MAKVKPMRKFVTRNLSEAIEKSVNDVVESGIDISELVNAVENEETIKAESRYSEDTLNELIEQLNKGKYEYNTIRKRNS